MTVPETATVAVRAEAHAILHRAGGGPQHLTEARRLATWMSRHLSGQALEDFWRHNRTAQLLRMSCSGEATHVGSLGT